MKGFNKLVLGIVGVLVFGAVLFLGMLIATDPCLTWGRVAGR